MKYPQVIVVAFDDWLAKQLRENVAENRWVLHQVRQPRASLGLVSDIQPTVLILQMDPHSDNHSPFQVLSDVHRLRPDVAIVVVSDVKLPDEDRLLWSLMAHDLGARCVLFPPLSRPVLEDVVSGLMSATIQRMQLPVLAPVPEPIIDLAQEGVSLE